jgi:hypothetical protein
MSDKDVKRIYSLWAHDSIAINDVLNESPNACARLYSVMSLTKNHIQ